MHLLADLPRFHYQRSTYSNGVCLVNINISWLYIMTVIVNFMGCSKKHLVCNVFVIVRVSAFGEV